jgi:hypothetical protein
LFFTVLVDCSSIVGYSSRVLMEELAEIERGEGLMEEREREVSGIMKERERKQGRSHKLVGPNNGNK